MFRFRFVWSGVVLAATVTACSDNPNAPTTITDPLATIQDIAAVDSAFTSDALSALQQITGLISVPAPPAPAPFARLAAALRLSLPPAPGAASRAALRRSVPRPDNRWWASLASASSRAPVIPDSLLGLTFEWNPDSIDYVASSRTGAPVNGLRFILYKTDNLTSLPDTGAEVGALDIIDKAPALGAGLQFLVRGVIGSPTFLDYNLTLLPAASAFTIQASGYISNGLPGALERRFTFNASVGHSDLTNGPSETVDFTYDVNVPDVTVELHLASITDSVRDTSTLAIDYRFTRRLENIRFLGADTLTEAGNTENGVFHVTVNSAKYATLTILDGTGTIIDRNDTVVPINFQDQQYEDDITAALFFGVLNAGATLAIVLALPAFLLGFSIGLLR